MSDTDSTYSMNPGAARPTALGDLRFAGTIAAGLVAGTLGLGALAAPLVGWKDWPSALTQQATSQPVVLAKALPRAGAQRADAAHAPSRPAAAAPCWTTSACPAPVAPGSGRPGGLATLIGNPSPSGPSTRPGRERRCPPAPPARPRHDRRRRRRPGLRAGARRSSRPTPTPTADGVKDPAGRDAFGKTNADGNGQPTGEASGLSHGDEFKIRSGGLWLDTNGDGFIDGNDDADGDGVSNAEEELNGTDPMARRQRRRRHPRRPRRPQPRRLPGRPADPDDARPDRRSRRPTSRP